SLLHPYVSCLCFCSHFALPLFSFFFSQRSAHHRDLHSFPTRRSSDLSRRRAPWSGCSRSSPRSSATAARRRGRIRRPPRLCCSRSEEHTSELQSRFDLVCRLLLEKKKKEYTECR